MPEYEVEHGEIWLHDDERVVETVPVEAIDHVGLVTVRSSGRFYASVLRLDRSSMGYRFDVPQWDPAGVDRVVCASAAESREVIEGCRARSQS